MTRAVPIYVGDEHNEAYYHWYLARRDGHHDGTLDVVHIDAHTDLAMAASLGVSLYPPAGLSPEEEEAHVRSLAFSHLDFANWIRPAVLARLVRNVFIVFPRWRKPARPRRQHTSIASAFGEGLVLKHGLVESAATKLAFPDLVRFRYEHRSPEALPRGRRVVLDLDLDYFACRDSIKNELSLELEISAEQYANRARLLEDRRLPFMQLRLEVVERGGKYVAIVRPLEEPEEAHLPSMAEIDGEIAWLFGHLRARALRPALVTVCRSCWSGCCPAGYVAEVEARVLAALRSWLG